MNKNLFLGVMLATFLIAGVFANPYGELPDKDIYYVGEPTFTLPQINVEGSYLEDSTHHTYFACYSALDDDTNVIGMSLTDSCEVSRIFDPTEEEVGEHSYTTAIYYNSREWTYENGWQKIDSGIDNNQTYDFEVVYNIPEDDFDEGSWLSGLFDAIQDFFCENFGLFCDEPNPCEGQAGPFCP